MRRNISPKACRAIIRMAMSAIIMLNGWTAVAQQEPDDQRLYYHEGGVVIISGNRIEVRYRGAACIGQFEGLLRQEGPNLVAESDYFMGARDCLITIAEDKDGALHLQQGPGCSDYHGARCSLSGTVYPVDNLPEHIP
jgi:hypothetical protein